MTYNNISALVEVFQLFYHIDVFRVFILAFGTLFIVLEILLFQLVLTVSRNTLSH